MGKGVVGRLCRVFFREIGVFGFGICRLRDRDFCKR